MFLIDFQNFNLINNHFYSKLLIMEIGEAFYCRLVCQKKVIDRSGCYERLLQAT